jgi:hypothetical protein
MSAQLFNQSVDKLVTILEEGARANARVTRRFIEPAQGTLRRANSRRHHIIFGRRGSGKSSLLFKSAENLSEEHRPIAYVDLEPFKGHHYPDLLISVLLAAFIAFRDWLKKQKLEDEERRQWFTAFLLKTRMPKGREKEDLLTKLDSAISELRSQLEASDGAVLTSKVTTGQKVSNSKAVDSKLGVSNGGLTASIGRSTGQSAESSSGKEINEAYNRSKQDFLHKRILDYQDIFRRFTSLTGSDCFLFLDDLYHIYRSDQPKLIDYFHRIAKGNNLWLKIGSIRNRSTWYTNAPQPIGLKIGDDADEINLDLTLEKFTVSRQFLRSVLESYVKEAAAPDLDSLVADGGLDRLVLASGGVTRDFLGLVRRAIDEAKERLTKEKDHVRGDKIGAEDVNLAAGAYGETKKEEFKRDTLEDRQRLEDALNKIRKFCLDLTKTNTFLVDQDLKGNDNDLLQELVDLRLIHHIKSRVTVSDFPGKTFRALLLDFSQYTGERKKRDVEMLEFWKDANKEAIRRKSLIYNPNVSISELEAQIREHSRTNPALPEDTQTTMFKSFSS